MIGLGSDKNIARILNLPGIVNCVTELQGKGSQKKVERGGGGQIVGVTSHSDSETDYIYISKYKSYYHYSLPQIEVLNTLIKEL